MRVMSMAEGIANQPEAWSDWCNQVGPVFNKRGDWRSAPIFYATTALTVELHEGERVQTFAKILSAYGGIETHAMGHSNGTRVILDGWITAGRPPLKTIHLLNGACDADCITNGINEGLQSGALGEVYIYWGGKDFAMRAEDTWLGTKLFDLPDGHQPMGLAGPLNVDPAVANRVHVTKWDEYDHSTCFDADHFNITLETIITNAERGGMPLTT